MPDVPPSEPLAWTLPGLAAWLLTRKSKQGGIPNGFMCAPADIFMSCSHEDVGLRDQLATHLRSSNAAAPLPVGMIDESMPAMTERAMPRRGSTTPSRRFIIAAAIAALTLLVFARPAWAFADPLGGFSSSEPALWLPVGVNLGTSIQAHKPVGFLIGGEVSLVGMSQIAPEVWQGMDPAR